MQAKVRANLEAQKLKREEEVKKLLKKEQEKLKKIEEA